MGSYVFKWPHPANDVHITGTFDDWGKSIQMNKVGDHWEKEVDLPSADDKVLYKFIVDDEWILDHEQPKEGDGHYNTNNVLMPEFITRKPTLAKVESEIPGAFPETPAGEPASFAVHPVSQPKDESTFSVNPIAATNGTGVTTSKEDYEKAGTSAVLPSSKEEPTFSVNPIPASDGTGVTTSKEDYERAGTSAIVPGTKDEQTFSVNPIPASSGIGNPITLAPGEAVPDQKTITSNTVDSTVTTSKEDYERAGSSGFPAFGAAGAAAGVTGAAAGGAAIAHAFTTPKDKNIIPESSLPMGAGNTIEANPFISSSAGINTTTADLASKVPFENSAAIRSSGPGTTTADLASKVPLENSSSVAQESDPFKSAETDRATSQLASDIEVPLKHNPVISSSGPGTTTDDLAAKVPQEDSPFIRSSGPETTTAALAAAVPLESAAVPEIVKDSIAAAHQSPEALASPALVDEKAALEKELLSKTHTSEATGESAKSAEHQTSYYGLATTVPSAVEKSMQEAHAAPEAAADTSAVAEKSAVEKELLSKVPSTDAAGEPAPTIAAATSTTAPATTSQSATSATAAATSLTDGKTANEPMPATDTSSGAHGHSAGEIAGGAAVGGAAAAGAAALASRHKDTEVEPQRVSDYTKPDVTTEASPATATKESVPVQSATTSAVSAGSTQVPPLAEEPAVKLMKQNEESATSALPVETTSIPPVSTSAHLTEAAEAAAASAAAIPAASTMTAEKSVVPESTAGQTTSRTTATGTEKSTIVDAGGIPSITSAAIDPIKVGDAKEAAPATTATAPPTQTTTPSAPSTPAKKTQAPVADSPARSTATSTATDKKKKRHRLSAFIKKIFD